MSLRVEVSVLLRVCEREKNKRKNREKEMTYRFVDIILIFILRRRRKRGERRASGAPVLQPDALHLCACRFEFCGALRENGVTCCK